MLKSGKVVQIFANNSKSKVYLLKQLPIINTGYWTSRVNLYTLDNKWSHVAHINTLINMPISSQA